MERLYRLCWCRGLGPLLPLACLLLAAGAYGADTTHQPSDSPRAAAARGSLPELERDLRGQGLKGAVHAANHVTGAYVFTWRDPSDFFNYREFPMIAGNATVTAGLAHLDRHQEVVVRGRFVQPPGAPPHLLVEALAPGRKWNPGVEVTVPRRATDPRARLAPRGTLRALVHAASEDGATLVIEYGGEVMPVVVPQVPAVRKIVASLYRGDRIALRYREERSPQEPLHLVVDAGTSGDAPAALRVLDRIKAQDRKLRTVEGRLVYFPKSPVLRRALYGVEEKSADGPARYYTIFNFDNAADEAKIDRMLGEAFHSPGGVEDARNKYVHVTARVRVTGTVNNPSPSQANPTLVTDSAHVRVVPAPGVAGTAAPERDGIVRGSGAR